MRYQTTTGVARLKAFSTVSRKASTSKRLYSITVLNRADAEGTPHRDANESSRSVLAFDREALERPMRNVDGVASVGVDLGFRAGKQLEVRKREGIREEKRACQGLVNSKGILTPT